MNKNRFLSILLCLIFVQSPSQAENQPDDGVAPESPTLTQLENISSVRVRTVKSRSKPGEPVRSVPMEEMSLEHLTTVLLNVKLRIESVHGYGEDKSVARLRELMKAEGVQSGLQFCQSWADAHALQYFNQVVPRLRPTTRRLHLAQQRGRLTAAERLELRKEALDAILVASKLERLLDQRLRGVAASALFWDRKMELNALERRAKGADKKRIRDIKANLEEERTQWGFDNIRRYTLHIEALPYPSEN